jgi:hypothetical protein
MFKERVFLLRIFIFLLVFLMLSGCNNPSPGGKGVVLMKLGDRVVMVSDFKQAFEMAMAAYPTTALTDRNHLKVARIRLLNQMTDELVIMNRADELQITVSDEELNTAINNIIKDYPDQTFDQVLVEQSISFNRWRESLRKHLLIEKTIHRDILGFSALTGDSNPSGNPKEKKNGASDAPESEDGSPEGDPAFERDSARDIYALWMAGLRKTHPVFIDKIQWNAILEE